MTEREHAVRFSLNGSCSTEGEVLSRALQEAAGSRRGSDLLRLIVLRGWLDLIHNCAPKERLLALRSFGISQELIDEIEARWPQPLIFAAPQQHGTVTAHQQPETVTVTEAKIKVRDAVPAQMPAPAASVQEKHEHANPMQAQEGAQSIAHAADLPEVQPINVVKPVRSSRLKGLDLAC